MDSNLRLVFGWQDHCPCLGGSCAGLLQGRGVPSGLDGVDLIRKENRVFFVGLLKVFQHVVLDLFEYP